MRILGLIYLSVFLLSCFSFKENKDHRLTLNQIEIREIVFQCGQSKILINSDETALLIEKINSAKYIGPVKGIVRHNLTVYLKNNDTINIRLLGGQFKWNKGGDFAYEMDLDKEYFSRICSQVDRNQIEIDTLIKIPNPIGTIKRVFDQYNTNEESTDSPDNLDSMRRSLQILETQKVSEGDLMLMVNIWLYYTVTDFSTLEYVESALLSHKEQSIKAVENRIANKMDWETVNTAPYSELTLLLEKLKEK